MQCILMYSGDRINKNDRMAINLTVIIYNNDKVYMFKSKRDVLFLDIHTNLAD